MNVQLDLDLRYDEGASALKQLAEELTNLANEGYSLVAVQQPNYPLTAQVAGLEIREGSKTLYLHLDDAIDYYTSVDEDEVEEEDDDDEE